MFDFFGHKPKATRSRHAPDRRAGPRQGPYVGKQPRTRNRDGRWRKKNSNANKPQGPRKSKGLFGLF
jgi:hypothetical protein